VISIVCHHEAPPGLYLSEISIPVVLCKDGMESKGIKVNMNYIKITSVEEAAIQIKLWF